MANKNFNKNFPFTEPRINREIVGHNEVRLIYKEHKDSASPNDFNKVVSPIVVRLEDYSKYLYNLKKQLKQRNKNTTTLKEIQLSANISMHDLQIKVNKAKEFIANGDKVKVVLTLKGRELLRREESKKTFYQFIDIMLDSGLVSFDSIPRDEEKKSIVIFKKK